MEEVAEQRIMMPSISSIQQNLYINGDKGSPKKPELDAKALSDNESSQQHEAKKHVVKLGSNQAIADAEAIFARANSYADVSAKVQKSLQAYEAVEVSLKREAVSQLMGVDIFA